MATCAMLALLGTAGAWSSGVPAAITTPDRVDTRIGTLEFKDGAPTKATLDRLDDQVDADSERLFSAAETPGIAKKKVLPLPGVLSTQMCPP